MNQKYASANPRLKLYLILAFASLILLLYSIWQIKPIIVEPTDLLGLASLLTPCYWIGLALILLCSVLAFIDRKLKSNALFVFILVVLGLFLFGIAVFSYECPRCLASYYPSAEVRNVIELHHVDIGERLPTYNSWPAIYFITASIVEVAKVDLLPFIRYFPLFWVFCFILITYSIGRRLKLPSNLSFLLSLFALSSFFLAWSIYNPQSIAMLLYLLCFMFILTPHNTVAESVLAILTFSALLITHSFAALTVLLALVAVSLYRRQTKFVALFSVLFLSWYMYQAFAMFGHGVTNWLSAPFSNMLAMIQQVQGVAAPAPLRRVILHDIQLSYLVLYFVSIVAAMALLWRKRVSKENGKQIIACIFWLVGVLGLGMVTSTSAAAPSLTDMLYRYYLYGLIPAACIIVLALRNKKLLITLMIILVALHVPAHYGTDAAWDQVLPTELSGAKFLALQVKPQEPCFYNGAVIPHLAYFYDPKLVHIPFYTPEWSFPALNEPDFSVLDEVRYVIIGKMGSDRVVWAYGEDPVKDWLQTETGKQADLIYNNVGFQIYSNSGGK